MKKHKNKALNNKDFSSYSVHSILRLINFIIDTVVWLTLYFLVAYILDLYFVRFSSYLINYIYSISLGLILYLTYYSVLEFYFHRTLGKFLTRTQVANVNGGEITFLRIFKRTISRLIPIDIFYYLFSKKGLHDRLSDTLVIKTNANKELS
ncbi:RDD family protein [Lutibacter aestuarii]|uniref:RDD family protein n=1 Tax=Lutibacter aestuarii TaxID=861111 RepID=A0ABW2Z8J3_9FLAO|nr:RDD family protein [uncultured Lutibacter sp.]